MYGNVKGLSFCMAAQRSDSPGRPRGDPVCYPVSALQHTEENSGHHHRQEVRLQNWSLKLFQSQTCYYNEPWGYLLESTLGLLTSVNIGLSKKDIYTTADSGNACPYLCASFTPHPCSPPPLMRSHLFIFFSLSATQKLGRRTVSDSAHRIVIWPGSCCGPHGPPGSLQGRVRGGARRHALARQATHPPGNQRALHRYMKQPNGIFHSSEMILLTVVCCFGFSVKSLASSVKMIHHPSDCLNLCASTHRWTPHYSYNKIYKDMFLVLSP